MHVPSVQIGYRNRQQHIKILYGTRSIVSNFERMTNVFEPNAIFKTQNRLCWPPINDYWYYNSVLKWHSIYTHPEISMSLNSVRGIKTLALLSISLLSSPVLSTCATMCNWFPYSLVVSSVSLNLAELLLYNGLPLLISHRRPLLLSTCWRQTDGILRNDTESGIDMFSCVR